MIARRKTIAACCAGNINSSNANARSQTADLAAKSLALYPTSLVDLYGRAIAANFIGGPGNANGVTWTNILKQSAFTSYEVPYPIVHLTVSDILDGQCRSPPSGALYEISPFEFGSWDPNVKAFFPTKFLGTAMKNGSPEIKNICTTEFDNVGLFVGTSSNIIPVCCTACEDGLWVTIADNLCSLF